MTADLSPTLSSEALPSPMLQLLLTRRSHLALTLAEPAPSEETLRLLLTAAARVPDHGKLAPWRFIVLRGAARQTYGDRLVALLEAREGPLPEDRKAQEAGRFVRAPLVVAVVSRAAEHPKIPLWEQELSAGAVCMNLLTATHAAGFAGQWLSEWMAFDDEAAALLGVEGTERIAGFIHIGSPTHTPADRARPDLDSLITEWTGA
ncbi:nitroreductase family protein [Stappia indica]|uniref:nitroreductase family protein n=1 Tax=Stappia indica TaxID=538381 RepID=UPI001CD6388D|nr:nitroreductase [Stappia indica]MCA1300065.1 nitroreductase [Stappia indica]